MRKILIPTDFSENAYNALLYAVSLFKYEKCEFIIFHSYADEVYNHPEATSSTSLTTLKAKIFQKSTVEMEVILRNVYDVSPNPQHTYKTVLKFGNLVEDTNELANLENVDICVMGTKGKTTSNSSYFGSNTLQVLKYIKCPVLCIPQGFTYQKIENIAFPTNYLIPYQKRELKLVAKIAHSFRSSIHLLYNSKFEINTLRQKENQLFIKEHFKDSKVNCHTINKEFNTESILDFIEKYKINLLIMVNSRHSFIESFLYESTVEKISLSPKIPLLVLQNFYRD